MNLNIDDVAFSKISCWIRHYFRYLCLVSLQADTQRKNDHNSKKWDH